MGDYGRSPVPASIAGPAGSGAGNGLSWPAAVAAAAGLVVAGALAGFVARLVWPRPGGLRGE